MKKKNPRQQSVGNEVTNVYAKFCNCPLRTNEALGIFENRNNPNPNNNAVAHWLIQQVWSTVQPVTMIGNYNSSYNQKSINTLFKVTTRSNISSNTSIIQLVHSSTLVTSRIFLDAGRRP